MFPIKWVKSFRRWVNRSLPLSRRRLRVEPLEERTLFAVTPVLTGNTVSFVGLPNDQLWVRMNKGVFEWSANGSTFKKDLDLLTPGDQVFTANQQFTINADAVTNTVHVRDMLFTPGGGVKFQHVNPLVPVTLSFEGNIATQGGDLSAVWQGDIKTNNNIVISTRNVGTGDPLTAPSQGHSGRIELLVLNNDPNSPFFATSGTVGPIPQITLGNGVKLLSQADGIFTGGNISLRAVNQNLASGTTSFINLGVATRRAAINLGTGAVIKGNNVSLVATSGDLAATPDMVESPTSLSPWVTGIVDEALKKIGMIPAVKKSPLALSLQFKQAEATVSIGSNAMVEGTGDIEIRSSAIADASGEASVKKAKVAGFSFALGQATSTAITTISAGAKINAGGDVTVASNADAVADMKAAVGKAGKKGGNTKSVAQSAIATGITRPTAHTTVAKNAAVNAAGNISVVSKGTSTNNHSVGSTASMTAFFGLTMGFSITEADIQTRVDGSLTAGGAGVGVRQEFNPLKQVDFATGTIDFGTAHGFQTGDELRYDSNMGGELVGLRSGHYYYVIVDSPTSIRLAATREDAFAGTAITFDTFPVLDTGAENLAITQIAEDTGTIEYAFAHGLTTGQAVIYRATPGKQIGNLVDGQVYFVIADSPTELRLAATAVDAANGVGISLNLDPQFDGWQQSFIVDVAGEMITFAAPHGFRSGTPIVWRGSSIPALQPGHSYYAIADASNPNVLRLAANIEDAVAETPVAINLGAGGSGLSFVFDPSPSFDEDAGVLDFGFYHQIANATPLTYHGALGTTLVGLTDGQTVYAITDPKDPYVIRLARTVEGANAALAAANQAIIDNRQVFYDEAFNEHLAENPGDNAGAHAAGLQAANNAEAEFGAYWTAEAIAETREGTPPPAGPIPVTVNAATDTIDLGFDHGFMVGDEFTYKGTAAGQPAITGLTVGKVYYAIPDPTNPQAFRVALSGQNAARGLAIDLRGPAGVTTFNTVIDLGVVLPETVRLKLNAAADTLTYQYEHGWETGDPLVYRRSTAAIGGLIDGQTYYAIVDPNDPMSVKLATSEANARAGIAVNITGTSTLDAYLYQPAEVDSPFVDRRPSVQIEFGVVTQLTTGGAHVLAPTAISGVRIDASLDTWSESKVGGTLGKVPRKSKNAHNNGGNNGGGAQNNKNTQQVNNIPGGHTNAAMFQAAGSFVLQMADNTVLTIVGGSAVIESNAGLDITSHLEQVARIGNTASNTVAKPGKNSTAPAKGTRASAALAVSIGDYDNSTRTVIEDGAQLDARQTTTINAALSYPYLEEARNAKAPPESESFYRVGPVDWVLDTLNDTMDMLTLAHFNSVTKSAIKGGESQASNKVGIAGSVDIGVFDNTAEAIVGAAKINQKVVLQTPDQTVKVNAVTDYTDLSMAGLYQFKLTAKAAKNLYRKKSLQAIGTPFGVQAGTVGVGGSALVRVQTNTTRALINAGARIHTGINGALEVEADQKVFALRLSQAGVAAGQLAVGGTFSWGSLTSTTVAQIADGVFVTGGGDLTVRSHDDSVFVGFSGSVIKGNGIGFGFTVAANTTDRATHALIGQFNGAGNKGSYDVGDVVISALATGNLDVVSLAAVASLPENQKKAGQAAGSQPLNNTNLTGAATGQSGQAGQALGSAAQAAKAPPTGLGVSGDVSINVMKDSTRAGLFDRGVFLAEGDVDITAQSKVSISSIAGAIAISNQKQNNFALAGSFSANYLEGTVEAALAGVTLTANTLDVRAKRLDSIESLTAGGAGTSPNGKNGIAAAGSVSLNVIVGDTIARISGANVTLLDDSSVIADDQSRIYAIAGAVAYGAKGGFGVSIGANLIGFSDQLDLVANRPQHTLAYVEDSTVKIRGGEFEVSASSQGSDPTDPRIAAVTGSLGLSQAKSSISGAGMISINIINESTKAYLRNSTLLETAGDLAPVTLDVHAASDSFILSVGGAIAVADAIGVGAAISYNEIAANTAAELQGTTVTIGGAAGVAADNRSRITTGTVGVAAGIGDKGIGAAGSASINLIRDRVEARIGGQSDVTAVGPVTLDATDESVLVSAAGGFGLGKQAAIGAAGAYNLIDSGLLAAIDDSKVHSDGSVSVNAAANGVLLNVTVGGAESEKVAFGGSLSVNSLQAAADAHIKNSTVTAGGDITVNASDASTLFVGAGGLSAATKGIAVGASLSYNFMGGGFNPADPHSYDKVDSNDSNITAYIENSAVTANGNLRVTAGIDQPGGAAPTQMDFGIATVDVPEVITDQLTALTVGGALGDKFALGAAVSLNFIHNRVDAHINNGTTGKAIQAGGGIQILAADEAKMLTVATGIAAAGKGAAAGGALSTNYIRNTVRAAVENAKVTALTGDIEVAADTSSQIVNLTVGGAAADKLALSGSVSLNFVHSTTDAHLFNSDVRSINGSLSVTAVDRTALYIGAGNFSAGKIAAGVALATSDVQNTITAYIDKSTAIAGNGDLTVEAMFTPPGVLPSGFDAQINSLAFSGALGGDFTGAGSAALSWMRNTVDAHISNIGSTQEVRADQGKLTVRASDQSTINSVAGGIAVGGKTATVGASIAYNYLGGDPTDLLNNPAFDLLSANATSPDTTSRNSVVAYIDNAQGIISADELAVTATYTGQINNLSLAGSGSSAATFALGGAVSLNFIRNVVQAYIRRGKNIDIDGSVLIEATDTAVILSSADAMAATGGSAAVGAAVSINSIADASKAAIEESMLDASGNVIVRSENESTILNLSAGGAGAQSVAVSGSVSLNFIQNTADAHITAGSNVTAADDVRVLADDRTVMYILAGSGGGANTAAVGVAAATTDIQNNVLAYVEASSVISTSGDIIVEAIFAPPTTLPIITAVTLPEPLQAQINTFAISGTGSGNVAVAGSLSLNWMRNKIDAHIAKLGAGQQVRANNGTVRVHGSDDSTINSAAGGISGAGTGAAGASLVLNFLGLTPQDELTRAGMNPLVSDTSVPGTNQVFGYIDAGLGVVNAATIDVDAEYEGTINNLSFAGTGAGEFAIGGAVSLNFIQNEADAHLKGAIQSAGDVNVHATDDSQINSIAFGFAGAGTVAAGAAVATNHIANDITAYIESATVTSTTGAVIVGADSTATIINATLGGAGSGTVAVSGSVSLNFIHNSTDAHIHDSIVNAATGVSVTSDDNSVMYILAGNGGGSGTAAAGVALATTDLQNSVTASIERSHVIAQSGDITVEAMFAPPALLPVGFAGLNAQINTIAFSGQGAGGTAIAGSASLNWMRNTVDAHVSGLLSGQEVRANSGNLFVRARDESTINSSAGGIAGGSSGAFGASISSNYLGGNAVDLTGTENNEVIAYIDAGAGKVRANNIDVDAQYTGTINNITFAGAFDGSLSIGAAVTLNFIRNMADASIKGTVEASGNVSVNADDRSTIRSGAIGIAGSGGVAGGAGFATNYISNDISAHIDQATVTATSGAVTVDADSEAIIINTALGGAASQATSIAGSTSLNFIHSSTDAHIADSTVTAGTGVSVTSDDTSAMYILAGAVAGSGGGAFGVSAATTDLQNSVTAAIEHSHVIANSGDLTVTASFAPPAVFPSGLDGFNAQINTIAISGAGAGGPAAAGSVSLNWMRNHVDAHISGLSAGQEVRALNGTLTVHASDESTIHSSAGGIAVGSGGAVGASVSSNYLGGNAVDLTGTGNNEVFAYIDAGKGQVRAADIDVAATYDGTINNITFAGSVDGSTLAIAGAATLNFIRNQADAYLKGNITAINGVTVTAEDSSNINSAAIGIAASGGGAGGGAFSTNYISNDISAHVDSGTVTATNGAVMVDADSKALIINTSVGIAGGSAAVSGSVSLNFVHNSTDAHIQDSTVTAGTGVQVTSDDKSAMYVLAGNGGGGGVAIGVAAATTDLQNSVTAIIDHSTVIANNGDLIVEASFSPPTSLPSPFDAQINTFAVSGQGAGGTAVAGSLSLNWMRNTVDAHISGLTAGQQVRADQGTLIVHASDRSTINSAAGGIAVGYNGAAGAAVSSNYLGGNAVDLTGTENNEVFAYIDAGAGSVHANNIDVDASYSGKINNITFAGAGDNNFSLGMAVTLNFIRNEADAYLKGSVGATNSITVDASDVSQITSIADGISVSTGGAVGAAVSTNYISNDIAAHIDSATVTATSGAVNVNADSATRIINTTVGGTAAGVAVSGSVSLNWTNNSTEARITGSTVTAGTSVGVTSEDQSAMYILAGNGGGGGTAIGVALATTDIQNDVRAIIDGSTVIAQTGGITVDAAFEPPVSLPAPFNAQINTLAISGQGAGSASAAGSAALAWIRNDVEALVTNIGAGKQVKAATGTLKVHASDTSTINSAAGTISGAGIGAAGASTSYVYLGGDPNDPTSTNNNRVVAGVELTGGTVQAAKIDIDAGYDGTINNLTIAGEGAGSFALGGSISLNFIRNEADAHISGNGVVTAASGITVRADDTSDIHSLSGQVTGAGSVAFGVALAYNQIYNTIHSSVRDATVNVTGGSLAVEALSQATIQNLTAGFAISAAAVAGSGASNLIGNSVEASIKNANITAEHNITVIADAENTIESIAGTVSVGAGGIGTGGSVAVNVLDNQTKAFVQGSTLSARGNGPTVAVPQWDANGTPSNENLRGLAVIASDDQEITSFVVTAGLAPPTMGGSFGIAGNISTNIVNDQTFAYIEDSNINSAADRGEAVRVRAHQNTDVNTGSGTMVTGDISFAANVDTNIIATNTQAFIRDTNSANGFSDIFAGDGVVVAATGVQQVKPITVGTAVGSFTSLAGAAAAIKLDSLTEAYIENADVNAIGNVEVLATNASDIDFLVGILTGSIGVVGAGGSLAVGLIDNVTRARITGSDVDATGNVKVIADSSEDVTTFVGTAGAGGIVGIAGAVAVITDNSLTAAMIESGVRASDVDAGADVLVHAGNEVDITDQVGTVSISIGGSLGASVDVILAKNTVDAHIGANSMVDAQGSVTVEAIEDRDLDSAVVAFSGGFVAGIAGAVSVISAGTGPESKGAGQIGKVQGQIDQNLMPSGGIMGLSGASDDHTAAKTRAAVNPNLFSVSLAADPAVTGTTAYIGQNAQVTAGDDITVRANELLNIDGLTGSGSVGSFGASVGGSAAVILIKGHTEAFVDTGALLSAGDDVLIRAAMDETVDGRSYAGQVGLVGLGAQVVYITDESTQRAGTRDAAFDALGTRIVRADSVRIEAESDRVIDAEAYGGTLGSLVAGVSIADITVGGSTQARVGISTQIGQQAGKSVNSLSVTADGKVAADADMFLLNIGVLAAGVNYGKVSVTPSYEATIGIDADVTTKGSIAVTALSDGQAVAEGFGISVGGAAFGAAVADVVLSPHVKAGIDSYSSITSQTSGISVTALHNYDAAGNRLNREARAMAEAAAGGIVAGIGADPGAEADAQVTAYTATGSILRAGTDVAVTARGSNVATADAWGFSVSGIGVGASLPRANAAGVTQATSSGSIVQGRDVTVAAQGYTAARADGDATSVGLLNGIGVDADSIAAGQTLARLDGPVTVSGDVVVRSSSVSNAKALSDGEIFGLVTVGAAFADAFNKSTTSATSTGNITAASLRVEAAARDTSDAQFDATSGGLINVFPGNEANATTNSKVSAKAGGQVTVSGGVSIRADSFTDADSKANGRSVGIIGDIGYSEANVSMSPVVEASINPSAVVKAGGAVEVLANHGSIPTVTDGTFNLSGVNYTDDTITFSKKHWLNESSTINYVAPEDNGVADVIPGLEQNRTYDVIVINENTIQLGRRFFEGVDTSRDTITFPQGHNLQTGDAMRFDGNVGGLTSGQTYYVRVIDNRTIKLARTAEETRATGIGFTGSDVGDYKQQTGVDSKGNPIYVIHNNVITFSGDPFADGQHVTYRAAPTEFFATRNVEGMTDTIDLGNHNYNTGDAVVYRVTDGPAIGNLINGVTYYVIKVDDRTIKLAVNPVNAASGVAIDLNPDVSNFMASHSLRHPGDDPIGGLIDGVTYYVRRLDPGKYQLLSAPGGSVVALDGTGRTGPHTLGTESADLTSSAAGPAMGTIRFNLEPAPNNPSRPHRFAGVGGALSYLEGTNDDGVATAYSKGSSGGFVADSESVSTAYVGPTVSAKVGSLATIDSTGNVVVNATSAARAVAIQYNGSGGFVSEGESTAKSQIAHTILAEVDVGALINTAGSFELTTNAYHMAHATAEAEGEGGIPFADAFAKIDVDFFNDVTIKSGAKVTAGHTATLDARSSVDTRADAVGETGGLGADAETEVVIDVGNFNFLPTSAVTRTEVGANATLVADTVRLNAIVTRVDAVGKSESDADSAGADVEADTTITVNTTTDVIVGNGAKVTGYQSVHLLSSHNRVYVSTIADADADSAGGDADATNNNDLNSLSRIDGRVDALITTGDLLVQSLMTNRKQHYYSYADVAGPFASEDEDDNVEARDDRNIVFSSDVLVLGGRSPRLEVDAAGNVVVAENVDYTLTPTQIIVNGVSQERRVKFETNRDNGSPQAGTITGTQSTITFQDTLDRITFTNYSTLDLVLPNGLDMVNDTSPTIEIRVEEVPHPAFGFDVRHSFAPTLLIMENLGTVGDADIIIGGLINNPIGTTIVTARRGDIFSMSPAGIIRTNILDAEATLGSVGTATNRLYVEMVDGVGYPIDLEVDAGLDTYLSLKDIYRHTTGVFPPPLVTVPLDHIHASRDIDLLLQETVRQDSKLVARPTVIVVESYIPFTTLVHNHFRPNGGVPIPIDFGMFGGNDRGNDSHYIFSDLTAGRDITILGVPGTTTIDVTANTNLTGASGDISVQTDGFVDLTEIAGEMRIERAVSLEKSVELNVPDLATSGQDLKILPGAVVSAATTIDWYVGDNIETAATSKTSAGGQITIRGDYGNADAGVGTMMTLRGTILGLPTIVEGHSDADHFILDLTVDPSFLPLPPNAMRTFDVFGKEADDHFEARSLPGGITWTLRGQSGNDVFDLGNTSNSMDQLVGPLTVLGGDHLATPVTVFDCGPTSNTLPTGDIVRFNDQDDSTSGITYTLTRDSLNRTGFAQAINYSEMETVVLNAGNQENTIRVLSTADSVNTFINGNVMADVIDVASTGIASNVEISSGAGNDTITVRATGAGSQTEVEAGDGADQINIGSTLAEDFGNLDNIQGWVCIDGDGNPDGEMDCIYINDRAKQGRANYQVTPNSVTTYKLPANFHPGPFDKSLVDPDRPLFAGIHYTTAECLRLDGTDDVNIFNVTPSPTTTIHIDGNLPPAGQCIPGGGDYLMMEHGDVTGAKIHITGIGQGWWDYTSNHQKVTFEEIERFNHVGIFATATNIGASSVPIVHVRHTEDAQLLAKFQPFPNHLRGAAHVITADVNCDGFMDVIVSTGPEVQPLVSIFDGSPDANGDYPMKLLGSLKPFGDAVRYGIFVAAGDFNFDGRTDLAFSLDAGHLPVVKVLDGGTLFDKSPTVLAEFNAFSAGYRGGVRLAAGDLNNDGYAEIVAGTGLRTSATVNVFDGKTFSLVRSFTPFGASYQNGANVAVGDYDGDGVRDIIAGAGINSLPLVNVYSGVDIYNASAPVTKIASELVYPNFFKAGVRVAAKSVDGGNPGFVEQTAILTGPSVRPNTPIRTVRQMKYIGPGMAAEIIDKVVEDAEFHGIYVG